ncbi:hypothetical protein P692DRAFT_20242785 [Suillus brevipes Sb2]|nr:hypothetical protein P692DRAFT_20242785 [Suillus brevipes Sb2]
MDPCPFSVILLISRNEITSKRKHVGFFSLDGTMRPRRSGAQNTQNPSPSTIGIKAQPHPSSRVIFAPRNTSKPSQTNPITVAVQHVKVHPDSDSGKHRPKFIRSKHPNIAIHSSPSLILMPEALPSPWIRRCRAWRAPYSCAVHQHNSQPPLINSTIYKLRYNTRHKYKRTTGVRPIEDFIFKYRRLSFLRCD